MTEQQMKETYVKRVLLDSDKRLYLCNDDIKQNYEKRFHLVHPDVKLLQFAVDKVGMTSDCFILYAISHLGCPTKDAIISFLSTLLSKNPGLHIVVDKDALTERLRNMYKLGLIMRYAYDIPTGPEKKVQRVAMYIITEDGLSFVRQHLKKRCTLNAGFYAKHIKDLIGWSSAAYASAVLAENNRGFLEFSDAILRTKQMGALFFSGEWKAAVDGVNYYVSFMPSFLEYDRTYMNESDYNDVCAIFVNTIRNYINCRTQKGVPIVVVTVQDNSDLNTVASCMSATGMGSLLDNVFFTSEALVNEFADKPEKAFLKMRIDASKQNGCDIYSEDAPFFA